MTEERISACIDAGFEKIDLKPVESEGTARISPASLNAEYEAETGPDRAA